MAERPHHPALEQGPKQRKPTPAEIKLKQAPWYPPETKLADASAIKGLVAGTASPDQQRHAIKMIIEGLCGTYDLSFRPGGDEGTRETDFAEGKRFVGLQIVKLININTSVYNTDGAPREQP